MVFLLLFSVFPSFATNRNDCFLVSPNADTSIYLDAFKKDPLILHWAIPIDAVQKALDNLQAHCCAANHIKQTSQTCQKTANNRKSIATFPQSASLFDQLLDVQFRRLTNDLSNYQGVTPDQKAKARNEKLTSIFTSTQWKLPWEIIQNYIENWDYQEKNILPKYHGTELSTFLSGVQNSPAINKTNERNLRSKYLNVCSISNYFTMQLSKQNNNLSSDLWKASPLCNNLTDTLIEEELAFLENTIVFKSNKLTTDTLQEYAVTYLGSRLSYLQTQIDKVNGQLLSATRQIPKLIRSCN